MTHRVAVVKFEKGTNDGVCICTCGDNMLASEFGNHRKALGLKADFILRTPDGKAQPFNRSINP